MESSTGIPRRWLGRRRSLDRWYVSRSSLFNYIRVRLTRVELVGAGGSNRRNARNSIADLATLYKSQLSALWEGVEGAQKFVPYVPGRHIITEAASFIELHAATYKPKQPVHLFLLNDAMLVSVKKRRGPGIGGAVRLVAERCFNLSEIVVVDLKDGGGEFSLSSFVSPYPFLICLTFGLCVDLQNAVKIKRGKETIIFRTDKPEYKKMLLLAFKKVAEELMNKKRKEMLSEAEARKGDVGSHFALSLYAVELALTFGASFEWLAFGTST